MWARTALELHPDWALVSLDLRNAFNSVSRAAALRRFRDEPALQRLYPMLYAWGSCSADVFLGRALELGDFWSR